MTRKTKAVAAPVPAPVVAGPIPTGPIPTGPIFGLHVELKVEPAANQGGFAVGLWCPLESMDLVPAVRELAERHNVSGVMLRELCSFRTREEAEEFVRGLK